MYLFQELSNVGERKCLMTGREISWQIHGLSFVRLCYSAFMIDLIQCNNEALMIFEASKMFVPISIFVFSSFSDAEESSKPKIAKIF